MNLDLVNGTVVISTGLFIFISGMAIFGLVIGGAMFATALASMMQRHENMKEIRQFNAMMLDLRNINKLWYGDPGAKNSFSGLEDIQSKKFEKKIQQEFLEDRD